MKLFEQSDGQLSRCFTTGAEVTIEEFESGELPAELKHDPEFSGLEWNGVSALGRYLDEFLPE